MYFDYGIEGYIMFSVIFLLCLIFFFYLRKTYQKRMQKETDLANRRYGIFLLIIGLILTLFSFSTHLYVQVDLSRSTGIFKMLSEISASPILFFTIVFFMIGLTLLFLGISSNHYRKQMLDKIT